jgi:hypothetical protein
MREVAGGAILTIEDMDMDRVPQNYPAKKLVRRVGDRRGVMLGTRERSAAVRAA